MHIKVTFPGSFTVFNPEDAGAFLKALANSQVIDSTGWGKDEKLSISKSKPTIELIDPVGFTPLPEPLIELQEQLRASESRWMKYYNESNAHQRKIKELEAKLGEIKAATSEKKPTEDTGI